MGRKVLMGNPACWRSTLPKTPSCNYDHFTIAFPLIKLSLVPQNGHYKNCVDRSLIENLIAPASVKMNSTAHVISGMFQNFTKMLSKARGCNLKTCNLLKGTPKQSFSWTFSKIFKTPLKSLQLQKSICSGFFKSIVDCRINPYNFIKRELYYIDYFCGYF